MYYTYIYMFSNASLKIESFLYTISVFVEKLFLINFDLKIVPCILLYIFCQSVYFK